MKLLQLSILLIALTVGCRRADYKTGEEVFRGECINCHLLNGEGGKRGPDLTRIFQKRQESYIRDYIMDPRSIKPNGTMPPARISERELDMVMQYLKGSQKQ